MKRLTKKYDEGSYGIIALDATCTKMACASCLKCEKHIGKIINRVGAYEDSGLEPEETKDLIEAYKVSLARNVEYGTLEEQGLLIKLPCKVGDTIYFIKSFKDELIVKATIENIHIWSSGHIKIESHTDRSSKYWTGQEWSIKDIGKTVFLTREEAEKHLEEK